VLASGSLGTVHFDPQLIDLSTVRVGAETDACVYLENTSACSVYYLLDYTIDKMNQARPLHPPARPPPPRGCPFLWWVPLQRRRLVAQELVGGELPSADLYAPFLVFDKPCALIPANCRQRLNLRVCAHHPIFYSAVVSCRTSTSPPPPAVVAAAQRSALAEVHANAIPFRELIPPQLTPTRQRCGSKRACVWTCSALHAQVADLVDEAFPSLADDVGTPSFQIVAMGAYPQARTRSGG
jgi:hypothetical protein